MIKTGLILIPLLALLMLSQARKEGDSPAFLANLPPAYAQQYDSLLNSREQQKIKLLKILYGMMPLEDLLDYPPNFYWQNIGHTLRAKASLNWGDSIPDDIFRYYVLPLRINNENLDSSRGFFFEELKTRIRSKSMLDAALEVNHWAHEHMTYQASDNRTSSPMTSYRNTLGRCGEESVFVVAALRSVGIPARQIYTPRWAHTDDNHAWIEFWAGGRWHFMGATEPLPKSDEGWFKEPARRAMMIESRVFGPYHGRERINYQTAHYTMINNLPVYAKTKEVFIKTMSAGGEALADVKVDLQLYNYGEMYTISPKTSDAYGLCSILTGYGDLWVWASKGGHYAFTKLDVRSTDTLRLTLNKQGPLQGTLDWDYHPPAQAVPLKKDSTGEYTNARRLQAEDSLRHAYENTFPNQQQRRAFARSLQLPAERTGRLIKLSRGNWKIIETFLSALSPKQKELGLKLLLTLNEKDLHDINLTVLNDYLNYTLVYDSTAPYPAEVWEKYILNPRVEREMLRPHRAFLRSWFIQHHIHTADELYAFLRDSIKISRLNYVGVPISVKGCLNAGISDEKSRKQLFVKACRTLGVPARLASGTLEPEIMADRHWVNKRFRQKAEKESPKGFLHLTTRDEGKLLYYKHFTLAKMQQGHFVSLKFPWDMPLSNFDDSLALDTGNYRLTTGRRLKDGSVLVRFHYFSLYPDSISTVEVSLRRKDDQRRVLARIDKYYKLASPNKKACTLVDNSPIVALWIDPKREPTRHIFAELQQLKKQYENRKVRLLLLSRGDESSAPWYVKNKVLLPRNCELLIDPDLALLHSLEEQVNIPLKEHLPVVSIIEADGSVTFLKYGYQIGIGEELLNLIP